MSSNQRLDQLLAAHRFAVNRKTRAEQAFIRRKRGLDQKTREEICLYAISHATNVPKELRQAPGSAADQVLAEEMVLNHVRLAHARQESSEATQHVSAAERALRPNGHVHHNHGNLPNRPLQH
jgi:hypothetical protein